MTTKTTLRRKIGQTMVLPIYGSDAYDVDEAHARANVSVYGLRRPCEIIESLAPAGLVLVPRIPFHPEYADLPLGAIISARQLAEYTEQLQEVAARAGLPPLLIVADQEGGNNSRLPVSALPAASLFGASNNPSLAEEAARLSGEAAARLGVNVILSPVADIVAQVGRPPIGERSFGTDPVAVAAMVAASVRGLRCQGVASAVKHWPGHGRADADSHDTLPSLSVSRPEWEAAERVPFAAAVEAGVDIVLAAHLQALALDPTAAPASSSAELTRLLRDELGFGGVVMTDALWMPAARDTGRSDPEVALAALTSGLDLLLAPPYPQTSMDRIVQAVELGELDERRIDEARERIYGLAVSLGADRTIGQSPPWEERVATLTETVERAATMPTQTELQSALEAAGGAHHDYESSFLEGVPDKAWSGFYAAYVLGRLGDFTTPTQLTRLLESAPSTDSWAAAAAPHVLENL